MSFPQNLLLSDQLPAPHLQQIPMLFKVMSEEDFSDDISDLAVRPAAPSEEEAQPDGELKDVASFADRPCDRDTV